MKPRDWSPWLAALGIGVAVGWWWGRRSAGSGPELDLDEGWDGWVERWGDRVDTAVGAAATRWREIERRLRGPAPVPDRKLTRALEGVAGGEGLEAHSLAPGVVDVTGEAADDVAEAACAVLEAVPGVEVVLNRIWTPSSAAPVSN